jgi:hypothetical protein
MYWISRVWIKAKRHELTEDPVVFVLINQISVCIGSIVDIALYVSLSIIFYQSNTSRTT